MRFENHAATIILRAIPGAEAANTVGEPERPRRSDFLLRFYRVLHGKVVEADDIVADEVVDVRELKREIQHYLHEYLVLFEGKPRSRERPCYTGGW